jgi:hypothetical protein
MSLVYLAGFLLVYSIIENPIDIPTTVEIIDLFTYADK